MPGIRCLRAFLLLSLLAATVGIIGGCAVSTAPCLQYSPQRLTRIESLRGFGAVEVTRDALVCTRRAGSINDLL